MEGTLKKRSEWLGSWNDRHVSLELSPGAPPRLRWKGGSKSGEITLDEGYTALIEGKDLVIRNTTHDIRFRNAPLEHTVQEWQAAIEDALEQAGKNVSTITGPVEHNQLYNQEAGDNELQDQSLTQPPPAAQSCNRRLQISLLAILAIAALLLSIYLTTFSAAVEKRMGQEVEGMFLLTFGAGLGASCGLAAVSLSKLFETVQGFWGTQPAFCAHQLVAFPLMLYVTYTGTLAWFTTPTPATADERILGTDAAGAKLAAIMLGAMLLWDIPSSLLVKSLYSLDSLAHHIGLAIMAVISLVPMGQYYAPFFVGVIEISSVPLQVVDFFHPKHFEELLKGRPLLGMLHTVCRGLFLLSFIVLRTVWFPIVSLAQVAPDVLAVVRTAEAGIAALAMLVLTLNLAFMGLQWYWSYLLLRQIVKMLKKKPPEAPMKELV